MKDLNVVGTLGVGAFGRVELVVHKKNPDLVFAMKKVKKVHIVELQQQAHVLNEKKIMMSCRSPFIARCVSTGKASLIFFLSLKATSIFSSGYTILTKTLGTCTS